jgi:hypothetical protein
MMASTTNAPKGNSFPKLGDILVNLSVKNTPKVTRKLRLIGDPYMFFEFTDKQYVPNPTNDPAVRGKTVKVPFPDADVNKSFNRIGHDEPSQCPWKKMGYICTTQFAQNCLEKQDDGTWVVKILKKGKSIFQELAKWQNGRLKDMEDLDEDERENFIFHLGTRFFKLIQQPISPNQLPRLIGTPNQGHTKTQSHLIGHYLPQSFRIELDGIADGLVNLIGGDTAI